MAKTKQILMLLFIAAAVMGLSRGIAEVALDKIDEASRVYKANQEYQQTVYKAESNQNNWGIGVVPEDSDAVVVDENYDYESYAGAESSAYASDSIELLKDFLPESALSNYYKPITKGELAVFIDSVLMYKYGINIAEVSYTKFSDTDIAACAKLHDANIINGIDGDTFGVTEILRRKESCQIFVRLLQSMCEYGGNSFSDVAPRIESNSKLSKEYADEPEIALCFGSGMLLSNGRTIGLEYKLEVQQAVYAVHRALIVSGVQS